MVPPAMISPRQKKIYQAALFLIFAGLALLRADLVEGAFNATLASLASGRAPALKVVSEIALFASILLLTAKALTLDADPVRDLLIVLPASCFGFLAELWGTHSGLWTYFTGERPPYWIIPAWSIGALVVERLSRRTDGLLGVPLARLNKDALYWAWVLLFYCVFISFLAAKLRAAQCLLPAALTAAVLIPGGERRRRDISILLTGTFCVFWADLWGTTNHCWTYHTQAARFGTAYGISFGAMFDPVIVLAAVKTAEFLRRSQILL